MCRSGSKVSIYQLINLPVYMFVHLSIGRSIHLFQTLPSLTSLDTPTDRGLDVPNTALVVQMSLPREHTTYLHRAGRTGRNGRFGRVVTLTDGDNESFAVRKLENELGIDISKRVLKKKKKN